MSTPTPQYETRCRVEKVRLRFKRLFRIRISSAELLADITRSIIASCLDFCLDVESRPGLVLEFKMSGCGKCARVVVDPLAAVIEIESECLRNTKLKQNCLSKVVYTLLQHDYYLAEIELTTITTIRRHSL